MSPEKPERSRPRSKRFSVEFEEERAWVAFYRRVGNDALVATEVLSQLDADPEAKRRHLALYMCCKESLRGHKQRQARNRRIGQFVRWLCHGLFVRPFAATRVAMQHGREIAVECLPEQSPATAANTVRRLRKEPALSQAPSDLDALVASSSAPTGAQPAGSAEVPRFNAAPKAA